MILSRQLGLEVDIETENRQGFKVKNKEIISPMAKLSAIILFKRRAGKVKPVDELRRRVGGGKEIRLQGGAAK